MKTRVLPAAALALSFTAALAAGETPEQCKAESAQLPADHRDAFMQSCLAQRGGSAPSSVSSEQRAKVCDTIAARENFQGDQLAAFLKSCRSS